MTPKVLTKKHDFDRFLAQLEQDEIFHYTCDFSSDQIEIDALNKGYVLTKLSPFSVEYKIYGPMSFLMFSNFSAINDDENFFDVA
jgi:hypothetical protein